MLCMEHKVLCAHHSFNILLEDVDPLAEQLVRFISSAKKLSKIPAEHASNVCIKDSLHAVYMYFRPGPVQVHETMHWHS